MPEQLPGIAEAEYYRYRRIGVFMQGMGAVFGMGAVVFAEQTSVADHIVDVAVVRGGLAAGFFAAAVGLLYLGGQSFVRAGEHKARM